MTIEQMHTLVKLGAEAGRQEVLLARHEQRAPEIDYDIGLAHTLLIELKRLSLAERDRDHAVALFNNVYAETVKNCEQAIEGRW
jgi:hypothetical protein